MSVDTKVRIAGVEFRNPIIAASGTVGFGAEYAEWIDMEEVGGLVLNGLTAAPKSGSVPPRIAETPSGIVNSVGLQNPGVVEFLRKDWDSVSRLPTVKIANVSGSYVEEYTAVAAALDDYPIDMLELNGACPNAADGGLAIGSNPGALMQLTEAVKQVTDKPVIVKLTPNVTNIVEIAAAARDGGADAISLIGTVGAMAIDARARRPILGAVTGGLSGPAIKPIALRMVYQVAQAGLGVPIIGMGGISTGEDAAEFMIAGADAVMVGTASLRSPDALVRIANELREFAAHEELESLSDLIGTLRLD